MKVPPLHRMNNKCTLDGVILRRGGHPLAIYPNETVGAAPVCPPERPRSGVSIPKIHALCAGEERWMRPCRARWPAHRHGHYPCCNVIAHFRSSFNCRLPGGLSDRKHGEYDPLLMVPAQFLQRRKDQKLLQNLSVQPTNYNQNHT